jgi:hypothetical protein
MLEDEGTLIAMHEYMVGAGKMATSEGLSKWITESWADLAVDIALQIDGMVASS